MNHIWSDNRMLGQNVKALSSVKLILTFLGVTFTRNTIEQRLLEKRIGYRKV